MKVEIRRKWETELSVCGEMWIDGQFECYTLEPSRLTPIHVGHPCIPAGTYRVGFTPSPHLGYVTPEVMDVPGRTHILWHIANRPEELLGCTAVGEAHSKDWVGSSAAAFKKLMVLLKTAEDGITVTYLDPPAPPPEDLPASA